MILETSWGTATGWIIVRDALLIGPWRHDNDPSRTHRRTPTDYDAEHILLRTIRCVSGEVQTVMDCEPVFDYGQNHARWDYTDNATTRPGPRAEHGRSAADPDHRHAARLRGRPGSARTLLKEGDTRFVALSWGGPPPPEPTTRPTGGWSGPRTTGSTGWPAAASRTTRGGATCSAAP